jgi:hypothetical protein
MENNNNPIIRKYEEENSGSINVAELLSKMLSEWKLFAVCVVVALVCAFAITKYSSPQYETEAAILIKSNDNQMSSITSLLGEGKSLSVQAFQNEIGTIQSFTMVKRTVKALPFYVSYYKYIGLKNLDIYKDSPFEVEIDTTQSQSVGIPIEIKLKDKNTCVISYSGHSNAPLYDYSQDRVLERKITIGDANDKELKYI